MKKPANDRSNIDHLLELIDKSTKVDDAIAEFCRHYRTPFVAYHMLQTMAPEYDAPFVRTTYPDAWVGRYLVKDYIRIDPVAQEGFQRHLPFHWSEITIPAGAMEFMQDAIAHGVEPRGYSIPVLDKLGRRALFSVNGLADESAWTDLVSTSKADWLEIAHHIHKRAIIELFGDADPMPKLGPREIECLQWTARGKDAKTIALLLNLSEHTVQSYLKSAKFKLNSYSLAQAVSKAMALQIIKQ